MSVGGVAVDTPNRAYANPGTSPLHFLTVQIPGDQEPFGASTRDCFPQPWRAANRYAYEELFLFAFDEIGDIDFLAFGTVVPRENHIPAPGLDTTGENTDDDQSHC
jgi:hypothetical protein